MMDLWFIVSGIAVIAFGLAMMLVYRLPRPWRYRYVGISSSPIIIGFAVLFRTYGMISSVEGWGLIAFAMLLFWVLFYDIFFRKHYPPASKNHQPSSQLLFERSLAERDTVLTFDR